MTGMTARRSLGLVAANLILFWGVAASQGLKVEDDQRYLLLATKKTSTMQKELSEAAAMGFRVVAGSPTSGTEMALFLERQATPQNPYRYQLLATSRTKTMEKELNEAALEGYQLLPGTMIAKKGMLSGVEIVVVLELTPVRTHRYSYKLLATTRTRTLQKEVPEAQAQGFELVGMVSRGEHIVIMEQATKTN